MIRKLCLSLQAYIRVFSTSGHCRHTLLWVLDELPVFPLSWDFGAIWSAVSAVSLNICSGLLVQPPPYHFIHMAHFPLFLLAVTYWRFVCIGVVCSIFYWGLSCTFPLGISGSEAAASTVLVQSLFSTSVCGSAGRHDTGDSFKVWTFFLCRGFFFLLLLKRPWHVISGMCVVLKI